MKAAVRAGIVVLAALATVAAAAAVNLRGPRGADRADPAAVRPAGSALLRPTFGDGSLERSIAALQERLRAIPDDWQSYASLGLAYVARARVTGDPSWYSKAEGALRASLRLRHEQNVDAVLGLGALALARHEFGAALEHGRAAATMDPFDADVYGVVGDALLELGRYRAAFAAFQEMVDTRPDLGSYARVSYARELLGDVPGAIEAMRLAFASAGTPADAAWAAHRLGELGLGRGDVAGARAWFERGLDLAPEFAPNLTGLAKVAWASGRTDLAIERYEEAVARYPSGEDVAALGDLYASTGRPDLAAERYAVVEAIRDLARASGVGVDLEIALFDADHGDPGDALLAARAEWKRRKSVHVADAYAWALFANGRYREAARLSERALRLGTRSATFLFHAGMIERALGHDSAARRLLSRATSLDPHFSILHGRTAERVLAALEGGR